jgi:Zn-dependent M28 family amino/carboxypeptidase
MLLALFAALPEEVDRDRLVVWVEKLEGVGSRVAGTPGAAAAGDLVAEELARLGLSVERPAFVVANPYSGEKVVAENVVGAIGPKEGPAWVVIAHLDSRGALDPEDARARGWQWDRDPSPGADDNASGCAALLELARSLSAAPPSQRVELVFSGAEEMATIAADGFMDNLGADHVEGEIAGAIAVDMLLRPRPWGDALRVYSDGRWASSMIAQAVLHASWIAAPEMFVDVRIDPSFTYSDHGSFWSRDIGAVLVIEDDFHHARYHTTDDRFDEDFYSPQQLARATEILLQAVRFLSQ